MFSLGSLGSIQKARVLRDVYPGCAESRARPRPGLVTVLSLFPLRGCLQCEKDLLGCPHLTEAGSDGSSDLDASSSPPAGSAPLGPRFSPLVLTWCSFPRVLPAQEELVTSWWSPWTWSVPPLNSLARFSCRKLVSIRFSTLPQATQPLSFKGSLYVTLGCGRWF